MIDREEWQQADTDSLDAAQVVREVCAAWGNTSLLSEAQLWETARGVAAYVGTLPPGLSRRGILQLVARALSACGETAAARRLYLLGTGLVRATNWTFTVPTPVWVVNLKPLAAVCAKGLEFPLYHGLYRMLDAIADVWDGSSGQGVLGLRHVTFCIKAALACPEHSPRLRRYACQLCRACVGKLDHLAQKRGWRYTPAVINLGG